MPSHDKQERVLVAQIAAHEMWAQTPDRTARTAPGRAASPGELSYWERAVDPEGKLPPAERAKRAESKRKAHFQRLALRSVQVRRAKKEARRA